MNSRHRMTVQSVDGGQRNPSAERRRGGARVRTIRTRLALILAVPTVSLVMLAGFGVVNQFQVAGEATAAVRNVDLVLATQGLIHSLQRERSLSTGLLGGAQHYRPQLDAQRRASDQNQQGLDRFLMNVHSTSAQAVATALGQLRTVGDVRGAVDTGRMSRSAVLDFYSTAIMALAQASADGSAGQLDPALHQRLEALYAIGDAKEAVALERGQLNGVFAQGRFSQDDYLQFLQVRAAKLEAFSRFHSVADPTEADALSAARHTTEAAFADQYETSALHSAGNPHLNLSAPKWSAVMNTFGQDLRDLQRDIGAEAASRAGQIRSAADLRLALYAGGAVLALAVALLLFLQMFRSIIRPLRLLAEEAREVAEHRLPGSVARIQTTENPEDVVLDLTRSKLVRRNDEFAEVADALDNLQLTAVRLAVEQAVMRHNTAESLANLGRRNQNLVRRQLGFISELERDEADPHVLSNLFELDHLATRMRRNAESLLILVGEHSPRRWSDAVNVGDVLRSAFAEVEDYRRVILRRADPAWIQGAAAAEVSHLLAELIDNALSFSPPDLEVEVLARVTGGGYHIAIVDRGVGMTAEAMAIANARLRGEQSFLVGPTRDLGHYVVGRLAERLDVDVWLHDSPLNGVTARIALPPAMVVSTDQPAPRPAVESRAELTPAIVPAEATTRNGLVKRQRTATVPRRPPPREQAGGDPEPHRSPGEVRSMLDNLRSGVQQAEQERARRDPS
ncbi:MAG: hypothetical protein JWN00_900 [Actinomycetia bacterium]|nr:hypothetical protein [Actinomycetes bacterium]